jgi:hypothetical protein
MTTKQQTQQQKQPGRLARLHQERQQEESYSDFTKESWYGCRCRCLYHAHVDDSFHNTDNDSFDNSDTDSMQMGMHMPFPPPLIPYTNQSKLLSSRKS